MALPSRSKPLTKQQASMEYIKCKNNFLYFLHTGLHPYTVTFLEHLTNVLYMLYYFQRSERKCFLKDVFPEIRMLRYVHDPHDRSRRHFRACSRRHRGAG